MNKHESLQKDEEHARDDVAAANELLSDTTSKLHDILMNTSASTSVSKQSVSVTSMMLDIAKKKCEEATRNLDELCERCKALNTKTHKLLENAILSNSTKTKPDDGLPAKKSKVLK